MGGEQIRDLLYVEDAVEALLAAAACDRLERPLSIIEYEVDHTGVHAKFLNAASEAPEESAQMLSRQRGI